MYKLKEGKKLREVLKNKYKMYWIWKRKRKTYEDTKSSNKE